MSQQNKMTSKMLMRENFFLLLKIKANIPKGEKIFDVYQNYVGQKLAKGWCYPAERKTWHLTSSQQYAYFKAVLYLKKKKKKLFEELQFLG